MKKLFLILGVLFILAIVGGVGLILYANHYVQSPAFKDKLVSEISKATGGTVQIDAISVSLFRQVEFGGIKMALEEKHTGGRSYLGSTKKIQVSFNLWSLLSKRVEITGLYLDSPDIKIISNPSQPAQPETAVNPAAPEQPGAQAEPSAPAPSASAPSAASAPASEKKLDLVIKHAEVKNGRLDITLPNGKRVLLENFNLRSDFEPASGGVPKFQGHAMCEKVTFDVQPPLTSLDTDFHFENDTLYIEKARGTLAGGSIHLEGQAKTSAPQPFHFKLKAADLEAKTLLQKQAELASAIDGGVNADVTVEGAFENPLDATGKGSANLQKGKITTKPIQLLMFTYQIPELQLIELTKAETDFTIGGRKVQFSRIEARSQHLRLDGTGWYDFQNDAVDLNLQPAFSEAVKNRLPPGIVLGLHQEADGFYSISFREWGPLASLQNDLKSKFGEGVLDNFMASELPQNLLNTTFDQIEGMIKNKDGSSTNVNSSSSIIDSILGDDSRARPDQSTNAAPAGSTNQNSSTPEKEIKDFFKKVF